MSYEVIWEPEALAQAEQFAKDNPDGVRQVFTAVDRLADARRRLPRDVQDRRRPIGVSVIHLGQVR
ncbi:type II toxin-antitoxin system RelE/ParE family toxin [Streptomyces shenzhenensis]